MTGRPWTRGAIWGAAGLAAILVVVASLTVAPAPTGPAGAETIPSPTTTAVVEARSAPTSPVSVEGSSVPIASAAVDARPVPSVPAAGDVNSVPSVPAAGGASAQSTAPETRTPEGQSLQERNEQLIRQLAEVHDLDGAEVEAVRRVFAGSRYIGQGNPAVTEHPATPAQCRAELDRLGVEYENPRFERICGGPYMAPLYDPATDAPEDARACIDQFEFPDIPCTYPVVWIRASEAAQMCEAMGKRLCDAHEWEGACAGSLQPPDYRFDLARDVPAATAFNRMRIAHNAVHDADRVWAYGDEYRRGICAAASRKSPGCDGGGWGQCGSNTYPTGMFPACVSPLGVYDQHGNAAEHMNLPLSEEQMASRGSRELGHTEMKGSWFIFDSFKAHEDACRWRAPYWHGSRVMDPNSHHNYHLGFRCCKSIDQAATSGH